MAWLIAIVCIILIGIFWRILLPIALFGIVVVTIGGGLLFLYFKTESDQRERKQLEAQKEVQQRINAANAAVRDRVAKANAAAGTSTQRVWEISSETDPASGEKIPRTANVLSENGLCRLQVEQRINGTRLTAILCSGLGVSADKDIEVKFDNRLTSDRMAVQRFSNGSDVFIPSTQSPYPVARLGYNEFLGRMTEAKKVALLLNIDGAGEQWFTFSLLGVVSALVRIGAFPSAPSRTQSTAPPKAGTEHRATVVKPRLLERPASAALESSPKESAAPKTGELKPRPSGLPSNATLNVYGNDWVCIRGYRRSGNECAAVQLPVNATLNVYGNDWVCARGYRRSGNECTEVQLPANATLNVYGNDWVCVRGYRRSGNECAAVQLPVNATLNVYGNDWVCVRGYRRSGNECVQVGG